MPDLSRRTFIQGLAATATTISLAGCSPAGDRGLRLTSLSQALTELNNLANAAARQGLSEWSWVQTLMHCAQSIDYSITGFPLQKSELFQNTVGSAAFNLFALAGRMHHNLAEPIPGAPALSPELAGEVAEQQLRMSIQRFIQHTGPLQPHFAYGHLSKQQYELAHAMHLADHFSAFLPAD